LRSDSTSAGHNSTAPRANLDEADKIATSTDSISADPAAEANEIFEIDPKFTGKSG
jgi:hypothetical protein